MTGAIKPKTAPPQMALDETNKWRRRIMTQDIFENASQLLLR